MHFYVTGQEISNCLNHMGESRRQLHCPTKQEPDSPPMRTDLTLMSLALVTKVRGQILVNTAELLCYMYISYCV